YRDAATVFAALISFSKRGLPRSDAYTGSIPAQFARIDLCETNISSSAIAESGSPSIIQVPRGRNPGFPPRRCRMKSISRIAFVRCPRPAYAKLSIHGSHDNLARVRLRV